MLLCERNAWHNVQMIYPHLEIERRETIFKEEDCGEP